MAEADVDAEIAALEAKLAEAKAKKVEVLGEKVESLAGDWLCVGSMDPQWVSEQAPPPYTEADMLLAIGLLEEAWRQFLKRRPNVNPGEPGRRGRKPLAPSNKGTVGKCGPGAWRFKVTHQGETVSGPSRPTWAEAMTDLEQWRREPLSVRERQRRPRGEGSVFAYRNGFRGQLVREGRKIYTPTLSTREDAEAALAGLVAASGILPAADRQGHACTACGGDGHNARTCHGAAPAAPDSSSFPTSTEAPKEEQEISPRGKQIRCGECWLLGHRTKDCPGAPAEVAGPPSVPAAPARTEPAAKAAVATVFMNPLAARRKCSLCKRAGHGSKSCPDARTDDPPAPLEEATAGVDIGPDEPDDDGAGWAPPDADGRQTCIPCDGEGIDRREGGANCCLNCDGEGYRWPEQEPDRPDTRLMARG